MGLHQRLANRFLANNRNSQTSYASNAVVTGAGSGIGRAYALELANRGGSVVCADINLKAAAETVEMIAAAGGFAEEDQAWAARCDVSKLAQVEKLAKDAEKFFGGPTSLVINNAGIGTGGDVVGDTSMPDWKATIDVNLWGVINGCHVFAPRLRRLGRGGIINVCSTAGFSAAPLMSAYNVSKAGALALSETLAAEMAGSGVTVSALCPTFVKTNIVSDGLIAGQNAGIAAKAVALTGRSPATIVKQSLDAIDRQQLYVVPQIEAKLIWSIKRHAPNAYLAGTRLMARLADRQKPAAADTTTGNTVVEFSQAETRVKVAS